MPEDKYTLQLIPMTKLIFDFCPENSENCIPLEFNPSNLTVNTDVNGRSLEDCTPSNCLLSANAYISNLLKKELAKYKLEPRWPLKLLVISSMIQHIITC